MLETGPARDRKERLRNLPEMAHGTLRSREPFVLRACYVTARSWEPWCSEIVTLPLALGSLGVESLLRHRSLLGALVFRDCYVATRSWEPWCSEMFTLPLALGSRGVENCLRHRSLLGAVVFRECQVTVRCWEP